VVPWKEKDKVLRGWQELASFYFLQLHHWRGFNIIKERIATFCTDKK